MIKLFFQLFSSIVGLITFGLVLTCSYLIFFGVFEIGIWNNWYQHRFLWTQWKILLVFLYTFLLEWIVCLPLYLPIMQEYFAYSFRRLWALGLLRLVTWLGLYRRRGWYFFFLLFWMSGVFQYPRSTHKYI